MPRRLGLITSLAVCLLIAGCGGSSSKHPVPASAPTIQTLLAQTRQATRAVHSFHFTVGVTLAASAPQAGSTKVNLSGSGDFSSQAVKAQLAATVKRGGVNINTVVQLLAGPHAAFVNYNGRWAGENTFGITELVAALKKYAAAHASSAAQIPTTAAKWQQLLTGAVTAGPTVDGQATWKFAGGLNASELKQIVSKYGQATPSEQSGLTALSNLHVSFLVGARDHLPRDLQISDSAVIAAGESASFALHVTLSNFGEQFAYTPPTSYTPLALGSLGSILGQSAASAGSITHQ